ncbi:uncharacterized protein LOC112489112 [Ziziphus jujuba]|uniref:Uncharacterized protein LOC112489112 n=2 Tax=Ziziphus jujuba TaxID=326968 RepID=A0A6P6FN12_ZIZJJ|nr:uncharacterized protein LOC112489112 [Ziziphus jujuba]KAH7512261.1 hypothetical protein FEM48_Zijuj12G0071800 [Ziziphus jujuba var. spinosa]
MTRKKVKLVWIGNDSARKASFKKRRTGLLKKVSELTTLCGVSAFVVVYGPDDTEPAVWPSRQVVAQLLARFQSVPEIERCKKMMNQESYLRERAGKMQEQLRKHSRKNKEMEMARIMHQIHKGKQLIEFETIELTGLVWMLEERMKEIRKRVEYFQQGPLSVPGSFLSSDHQNQNQNHQDAGGDADSENIMVGSQQMNGGDYNSSAAAADQGIRTATESLWWENSNGGGGVHISVAPQGYPPNDVGHGVHDQMGSNISPCGNYRVVSAGNYNYNNGNDQMGLPYGYFGEGSNFNNMNAGYDNNNTNVIGLTQMMNFGGISGGNDHQVGNIVLANYGTNINNGGNDQLGFGIQSYVNNNGDNTGGIDMGIGQIPFNNAVNNNIGGSSGFGSDLGLPSGLFCGGTNAGSDAGLPFDIIKNWPASFSP